MTETEVKNQIMLKLSRRNCKIFNRPTGKFYTKHGNQYTPVKINVKGASDLQGHRPDGRCFYIECKTPAEYIALMSRIRRGKTNQHDDDQINFLEQMRKSGALAGFAGSVEDAVKIVEDKSQAKIKPTEMIYCKNCQYYKIPDKTYQHTIMCCLSALTKRNPDDFCSRGERRTNP